MHHAFENCNIHEAQHSEGLGTLCWPIVNQLQPLDSHQSNGPGYRQEQNTSWPMSETWVRNTGCHECTGQDRCHGNPLICNPKYQYGVDDVGYCPNEQSCKNSYRCVPPPQVCSNPCPAVPGCNRLTTRCFDWPISRRERCAPVNTNIDLRPPRADLNLMDSQPERCPTCKRIVVDMACGPLGYNY